MAARRPLGAWLSTNARISPASHREPGGRGAVGHVERHRRAQDHPVRSMDRVDAGAVVQPDDIRGERAVTEPRREHHSHGDVPAPPFDQPHQRRLPGAERHRVGQRHLALVGGERCLQHKRVVPVTPLRRRRGAIRRNPPCPILGAAKQGGEAGRAVEARPAEPLDRAAAPDQRCRAAVADQARTPRLALVRRPGSPPRRTSPRRLGRPAGSPSRRAGCLCGRRRRDRAARQQRQSARPRYAAKSIACSVHDGAPQSEQSRKTAADGCPDQQPV